MKSKIAILTIINIIFLLSHSALASDRNLKGLSQVGLVIITTLEAEQFDVNESDIRLETELLFRKYGMKVLSKKEISDFDDSVVGIYLNSTKIEDGALSFQVKLHLNEHAELKRNKDIIGHIPYNDIVISWNTTLNCFAYPPRDKAEDKIMECLNLVNKTFINTWLKSNQ